MPLPNFVHSNSLGRMSSLSLSVDRADSYGPALFPPVLRGRDDIDMSEGSGQGQLWGRPLRQLLASHGVEKSVYHSGYCDNSSETCRPALRRQEDDSKRNGGDRHGANGSNNWHFLCNLKGELHCLDATDKVVIDAKKPMGYSPSVDANTP